MAVFKFQSNQNNVDKKIDILKDMISQAETKGNHIDRLRQLNFSVALFIFAGLFSFGISQNSLVVRICVTFTLTIITILLSNYDHSLHKYIHGWRLTKVELIKLVAALLNNSKTELEVKTYYSRGELAAEEEDCKNYKQFKAYVMMVVNKTSDNIQNPKIPSRMRVIFYILVRGAIVTLVPFLMVWSEAKLI